MPDFEFPGYDFRTPALLKQALTHASCGQDEPHNERLEFLGDAVLGLVIAEALYAEHAAVDEGALDQMRAGIVNGEVLAAVARECGLDRALRVSEGHRNHLPEPSDAMLEDALEALVGAIYLDGGHAAAASWVLERFADRLAAAEGERGERNPKGRLQERTQISGAGSVPEYELIEESGPDHAKRYLVRVRLDGRELGRGSASSKKAAESAAAAEALKAVD